MTLTQQAFARLNHGVSLDELRQMTPAKLQDFASICHHWAEVAKYMIQTGGHHG